MGNKWKTIAIIFIVLFCLETMFLIWIYKSGIETINNESECSINICELYDAYIYDPYDKMCYCYEDGEIVKQKYMK